jgi:hypothetical protein
VPSPLWLCTNDRPDVSLSIATTNAPRDEYSQPPSERCTATATRPTAVSAYPGLRPSCSASSTWCDGNRLDQPETAETPDGPEYPTSKDRQRLAPREERGRASCARDHHAPSGKLRRRGRDRLKGILRMRMGTRFPSMLHDNLLNNAVASSETTQFNLLRRLHIGISSRVYRMLPTVT